LDEYSATIAGMGVTLVPERPVLIITCGGVSLDVALVLPPDATPAPGIPSYGVRVVGSARADTGGAEMDAWLCEEIFSHQCLPPPGDRANHRRRALMRECERVKERLSVSPEVDVNIPTPGSGTPAQASITRDRFERLLNDHGFFTELDRTITRALSSARMRGYSEQDISSVVLTGGCAALPSLQEAVKRRFPCHVVTCDRPAWATVRGAALYEPARRARDTIRNDYALRYWDPETLRHQYRLLVRSGTPYPSAGQVARLVISASYDGQTHLGIPLCEIRNGGDIREFPTLELVASADGGLQCADLSDTRSDEHPPVWVNERAPTFLVAAPPAKKGEPRFEVTFTIDGERQLKVTARDVQTGRLVKDAVPVFRLT
jgi:molecular chaperone DnaK (HSP70)